MKSLFSRLGPGLLYAGAAVGVSHLIQSTRAGANYGWIMIFAVLAANVLKYPFFKAGPLYAAATNKSLLETFREKGKWAMALFYVVTIPAMFTVLAVVTLITASVFSSIFGVSVPLWQICAIILVICSAILLIGRYKTLSNVMKGVILLLTLTTFITLFAAIFGSQPTGYKVVQLFSFSNSVDVFFLIALVGWMPAPLDISLWHSEWTLEANREQNIELAIKKSTFDFNVGYWGTSLLAIAFVLLGAFILYGSGATLPSSGVAFSAKLIGMYVSTLGEWSFVFVALAAFTTMFSTTLTVLDAYPRILNKAIHLSTLKRVKWGYEFGILTLIIGALFVLVFQLESMKQLVDLATTISFLTAPVLATLIYWVVRKTEVKIFSRLDVILAKVGLIFLYCFSFYFIGLKYFK